MALHCAADQIQPVPVNDDIPHNDSDDSKERSRRAGLDSTGRADNTEDVPADSANNIDDERLPKAKGVLYPREEHEGSDEVAEDVHEVDMQKHGRDQPVNLPAQDLRLIVAAVLDEGVAVDVE